MALQFTPSDEKKAEVIEAAAEEVAVADVAEAEPAKLNIKIAEPQTYSIVDTKNQLEAELA